MRAPLFFILALCHAFKIWAADLPPHFGCGSLPNPGSSVKLDKAQSSFSIAFIAGHDFRADLASVFTAAALSPPAFRVSLHEDLGGKPAKESLAQSAPFVPKAQSWSSLPLDGASLLKGRRYHLVIKPDLARGGDHPVDAIGQGNFAAFASAGGGAFLVHGGGRVQGQPYTEEGARPVFLGQWQAQVLHPRCGGSPKGMALRVRKKGRPSQALLYTVFKHHYADHKLSSVISGTAAEAAQVELTWAWKKVPFPPGASVPFAPECYYLAFHSAAGSAAPGGCTDCYEISDSGAPPGAAGADEAGFDGGAHRSRAASSKDGRHFTDEFERDAQVALLMEPCGREIEMQVTPIPTPRPLDGVFP